MQTKQFGQGEVIFREGALGNTMYEIHSGTVGIFIDYGEDGEKKLTELDACRTAAEIGMLDGTDEEAAAGVKDHAERCAAQASGYDALL